MKRTAKTPDQLEAEYRRRKLAIREDSELSWEKKELAIKQLGEEHHRARREMEAA
jgi:hypothetical protein